MPKDLACCKQNKNKKEKKTKNVTKLSKYNKRDNLVVIVSRTERL